MRDVLFMLKPDFLDPKAGPGKYYCPDCALVEGVLSYFPWLKGRIEVREVDFPRPRPEVAAIFGDDHPGCPVLVFDRATEVPAGVTVRQSPSGQRYITGAAEISHYLATAYDASLPHP